MSKQGEQRNCLVCPDTSKGHQCLISGNAIDGDINSGSYAYDANGNLTTDPYNGFNISYNYLNRTAQIIFTSTANRYINYTYDASGNVIRKQQYDNVSGAAALITTTDYIGGFVYLTQGTGTAALSYFPIPEGRVLNNAGTLSQEFVIADHQGNARISFKDSGNGTPVVTQENSYYAFGMVMANSPVPQPTVPNKQLYNGGSEWQNDYGNRPDYYQTFNRNYDAALGRFIGVDPKAEATESMSTYQYANNNPIMFNDPFGDKAGDVVNGEFQQYNTEQDFDDWLNNPYGNISSPGGGSGGGSGSNNSDSSDDNAGYSPVSTDGLATNIIDLNGKTILHIEDGSNAVFQQNADGSLTRVADQDQGGTDLVNYVTIFNYYAGAYNGLSGIILSDVMVTAQAQHKGDDATMFAAGRIWIEFAENAQSLSEAGTLLTKNQQITEILELTGKYFGRAGGKIAPVVAVISNSVEHYKGEISDGEYHYNQFGIVASVGTETAVGAEFGGPWGAAAGLFTGALTWSGQQAYTGTAWFWGQFTQAVGQINAGLNNGWVPGR